MPNNLLNEAREAGRLRRIKILESESTDILENLASEEELVRQAEADLLCIFFWRNADCVVIGRHQDPEAECHMDMVKKLGIPIARRRTGGGAVFQDPGNLNVSFIAPADSLDEALCEHILLQALEKCGVKARKTGRNDLVLDDAGTETVTEETGSTEKSDADSRVPEEPAHNASGSSSEFTGEGGKFSGSASWETPEGNFLFHATLMFDVNLDRMKAVLNASPQKLARHRIASVRSRVANLCQRYPDLKMETLKREIIAAGRFIWMDAK